VQLVDQNKGSKPTGEALKKVVENFYFTDVISRRYAFPSFLSMLYSLTIGSSPTMARCSAAKETGNPETNFMAPGYSSSHPHGQVAYGQ
jgi:NADH dehydrogenase (ubiquinone) Fe-S protein 1